MTFRLIRQFNFNCIFIARNQNNLEFGSEQSGKKVISATNGISETAHTLGFSPTTISRFIENGLKKNPIHQSQRTTRYIRAKQKSVSEHTAL